MVSLGHYLLKLNKPSMISPFFHPSFTIHLTTALTLLFSRTHVATIDILSFLVPETILCSDITSYCKFILVAKKFWNLCIFHKIYFPWTFWRPLLDHVHYNICVYTNMSRCIVYIYLHTHSYIMIIRYKICIGLHITVIFGKEIRLIIIVLLFKKIWVWGSKVRGASYEGSQIIFYIN